MEAPTGFIVEETFKHRNPEIVRAIATRNGFQRRTRQGTKDSEIWVKDAADGGFWIIRMDTMGHDTKYHFGGRPHYHKNWLESAAVLQKYLTRYTPEAWVYADSGALIGQAGLDGSMHPDLKAKMQHIPR